MNSLVLFLFHLDYFYQMLYGVFFSSCACVGVSIFHTVTVLLLLLLPLLLSVAVLLVMFAVQRLLCNDTEHDQSDSLDVILFVCHFPGPAEKANMDWSGANHRQCTITPFPVPSPALWCNV